MAELGFSYDPSLVSDNDVLPEGEYNAQIIKSEITPTKAGDGNILTLTWELLDGVYAKRQVWQRLNIQNPNSQAQEIAQRDLKKITKALGLGTITNSDVLHGKPMRIRLTISPPKGDFDASNNIKDVKPYANPTPGGQAQPAGAAAPWNAAA